MSFTLTNANAERPRVKSFAARVLFVCMLIIAVALAHALLSTRASAQVPQQQKSASASSQGAQEIGDDEVITVTTSEVLLPVTVRDAEGRLATNLARENFRVWEEGREQPLSDLRLRRVPVDVLLMIDASSSAASSLEDFQRAVEEFSSRLAEDDRVALLKFDDRVELLQDWTTSRVQLRRALRRVTTGTFTHFNDALRLSARELFKDARRRHAVVVLSDGIDNGSVSASAQTALRALLEAGAGVYCISNTEIERAEKRTELDKLLDAPPSALKFNQLRIEDLSESLRVLDASEHNLDALTAATGGRLYKPASFDGLDKIYAEVAEELRSQYALYYTPLDKAHDGRFRRVEVRVSDATMRVSARVGYFAPRG
ncbi:MAG: Ca-activated chloride channel [Acidobacteriota bacterium]|nr:Ca-activated chloride channel [Acidobacteriota bacterium]